MKTVKPCEKKVCTGSACKDTFLCLLFGDKRCVLSSCSDMNSGPIYTYFLNQDDSFCDDNRVEKNKNVTRTCGESSQEKKMQM